MYAAGRYHQTTIQECCLIDKFLSRTLRYEALMAAALDRLGLDRIDADDGRPVTELADVVLAAVDAQAVVGRSSTRR